MTAAKRRDDGPVDLRQGTLDVLILRVLAWGPTHGHPSTATIREFIAEPNTNALEDASSSRCALPVAAVRRLHM